jgi:hypothetical protein
MFYKKIIIPILLIFKKCTSFSLFERENLMSLRNIVSSRAVISTVTNQFNNEFINENMIINEIVNPKHNIPLDLLYGAVFLGSIYIQYRYFTYFENKWKNIKQYTIIEDRTSLFLFIFMLVFTKNIQNAI